jgi:hypothetical protein
MNTSTLEGLLGMIVFGQNADTLEGMQYTAARLRQAAALLEYRYAVERRFAAEQEQAKADDSQQGEPLAPKPKRQRGRPAKAANGQAPHDPPPAGADPLFQTADSAATP